MYDVFFLSFDEPMADLHWKVLQDRVASARRVHAVPGIHAAHMRCADLSQTNHFFVVDADNEVLDFDFSYKVPSYDAGYVHLWQARNPLNGLEYGWGGIKLFPKRVLKKMTGKPLDMTTSFDLKMMDGVRSITHFNYAPFETWRSAFRECVKLTLGGTQEALERREVWLTQAEGPFAHNCLAGAHAGRVYAEVNRNRPERLFLINDYAFLREEFEATQ